MQFHMYADDYQLHTTFEESDINQTLNMVELIELSYYRRYLTDESSKLQSMLMSRQ